MSKRTWDLPKDPRVAVVDVESDTWYPVGDEHMYQLDHPNEDIRIAWYRLLREYGPLTRADQ